MVPNPPANTDELANVDGLAAGEPVFISRTHTVPTTGCDDDDETGAPPPPFCEFDDLLIWIPTSALLGELVSSYQLP